MNSLKMVDESTPLKKGANTVASSASLGSRGFSVVGLVVGIALLAFALTATDVAQCESKKTFVLAAGIVLVSTATLSAIASVLAMVVTACCCGGGRGSRCTNCVTWMNALCGVLGSCLGLFNLVWLVHGCVIFFPAGLQDPSDVGSDCTRLQQVGFIYCVFALFSALVSIVAICCCGACCVFLCASMAREGEGSASGNMFGEDVNGFGKAPGPAATEYASVRTGPRTGGT